MTETENKKSTLVNRNIRILGRRTSIRLEPVMWEALNEMVTREHCTIHELCSLIHLRKKSKTSLTAAIRIFIVLYFRKAATEEGHKLACHGNFSEMIARAKLNVPMPRRPLSNLGIIYSKENTPSHFPKAS